MKHAVWALAVLLAGIAGYLLGQAVAPPADRTRNERPPIDTAHGGESSRSPAARVEGADDVASDDASGGVGSNEAGTGAAQDLKRLLGEEPDPQRAEEARRQAEELRKLARRALENADSMAAQTVARAIRAEREAMRALREDQKRGGAMGLLRGLPERDVHPFAIVEDVEGFGALFERVAGGPVVDGPAWSGEELADGSVVTFPDGAQTWQTRQLPRDTFPRDLLVQGQGMDRSLVRLKAIGSNAEIYSLTFRDLTIACDGGPLTDLRSRNPVTIRLERCRVVGFDVGAGGSEMLGAYAAALHATDCVFEAGYSRTAPGFGHLFRVHRGLLARLDHCTIRGPFQSVFEPSRHATFVFHRCTFEDVAQMKTALAEPPENVRFQDCTAAYGVREARKRALSEINPDWR